MAGPLVAKSGERYSEVVGMLRCRFAFAMERSDISSIVFGIGVGMIISCFSFNLNLLINWPGTFPLKIDNQYSIFKKPPNQIIPICTTPWNLYRYHNGVKFSI
jgi:hypothetical protein